MVLHECPYCSNSFPVHWTECAPPYSQSGRYSGPEVFCPHCRKMARFPQATLMRAIGVAIGALCLPLALVLALHLDDVRFAVPGAFLIGLPLSWFLTGHVCSRFGRLVAKAP
jgi:hypothetical protein